jgi:serine/threonine protein kinase
VLFVTEAESEMRVRFDRETRVLAGLSHPHIVKVLDYGVW